ncbi:MAG: YeiH family protein [Clostridiales bacterium]|nr:YeiH family protein [Clostridiales bacterium]
MAHSDKSIKEAEIKFERKWYHIIPGILLSFAVAFPSWLIGMAVPVVGGPIIAILIGIAVSAIFPRLTNHWFKNGVTFEDGVKYTSKKLLQYSVVLLGFSLNFFNVVQVGGQTLLIMLVTMALAFVTAFFVGKLLKLPGNTTALIGVGTAICGGSAIAAAAPVLRAKDEDVSQSISTIFLFNIIGALIFPALGMLMHMGDTAFGTWAGVAITDTSSVVAAGTSWSSATGSDLALQIATISKLTRALMIVPVCLVLALYTMRKHKRAEGGEFSFVKVFPWFVLAFVVAAVLNTFANLPAWMSVDLTNLGKFVIIMAMGAIGLNTHIKELFSNGIRPILLGASCWIALTIVSLIIVS